MTNFENLNIGVLFVAKIYSCVRMLIFSGFNSLDTSVACAVGASVN